MLEGSFYQRRWICKDGQIGRNDERSDFANFLQVAETMFALETKASEMSQRCLISCLCLRDEQAVAGCLHLNRVATVVDVAVTRKKVDWSVTVVTEPCPAVTTGIAAEVVHGHSTVIEDTRQPEHLDSSSPRRLSFSILSFRYTSTRAEGRGNL